jgi:gamma-glutamylcyclotransferase
MLPGRHGGFTGPGDDARPSELLTMTRVGTMYYFAYGSNMSSPRLTARIPDARVHCTARLLGYRLRFRKIGRDGSAKCDAEPTVGPEDVVHGVVYQIAAERRVLLDACEGLGRGYRAADVRLTGADGHELDAFCYLATRVDPGLRPFDWYREHVLRGAREHSLPPTYRAAIAAVPVWPDPDWGRRERELAVYRV